MTKINLIAMEPGCYGAQVEEGHITTSHRVHVSESLLDDLLLADVDRERVVEEALGFLLDREPATAIPDVVDLDALAREHEDFAAELQVRLRPA